MGRMDGRISVAVDPAAQHSPLADLLPSVPESLYAIAPERLDALRAALHDGKLEVGADNTWVAHYEFASKTIRVSMRTFEIIWSASFAYLALHDLVWVPGVHAGCREADLTQDPRLVRAMELLSWAMLSRDLGRDLLEELMKGARADPLDAATDELALCAMAFVLHHELAHHRLHHDRPAPDEVSSIDRERDADHEAATWMLGGVERSQPEYRKRLLGAALATVFLTTYAMESRSLAAKRHPRAFDRLFNLLDDCSEGAEDDVWCFAMGPVKLHLDHLEIPVSVGPFDTCRDALNACIEQLAELAGAQT